jgi:predicted nucleic acid-binding protein
MSVLVDSDILIEVSRGRNTDLISRWAVLSHSDVAVLYSPVSVAELWAGAHPAEHDVLTNLFRALTCVPIDTETGRQAGDYLRRYRKSHGVELGDALVAAGAVVNSAALWTRSRKHYPMKDLAFF